MKILVVGGAGYIGSHMVKLLLAQHCDVVTLDNLSSGHRDAVLGGKFVHGDIADTVLLDNLFLQHQFDAVMHFASFIQVGESINNPSIYYRNNVSNTLNLLDAMTRHNILSFVFSSTAAIFGEPQSPSIDESHPKDPINPYGRSKLMIEQALQDYDKAYGLKSICLRYFNAAGADAQAELGERHDPETHLIPLILQTASGKRDAITIFGQDYSTPDGTCIRDYIHIQDLCHAHWLAIKHLKEHGESQHFNLGNGHGFSVQEVIDVCLTVTGEAINVIHGDRRPGDPAILVADSTLAKQKLGWQPQHHDLKSIIQHAWNWEKKTNGR